MTTDPTPNIPAGRVVGQVEAFGKDASGNYGPGVNVTAALDDSGTTFTVFVPQAAYNPENVQKLLEARAAQVAAVHSLAFGG